MAVVGIRQLSRDTSRVIKEFEETGEPVILTREGRPIGALVAVDQDQLQDLVLATAPGFRERHGQAKAEFESGEARPLAEAARERGIDLSSAEAQVGLAEEGDEVEGEEGEVAGELWDAYRRATVEVELRPLASALDTQFADRIFSDASEEIETLDDEVLIAMGEAEGNHPAELEIRELSDEVRELTELNAALYSRYFRHKLIGQLGRTDAARAIDVSRRDAARTIRLMKARLISNPQVETGDISLGQYVASLRELAGEDETDEGESVAPSELNG
jgi:prevent-host-death family protein